MQVDGVVALLERIESEMKSYDFEADMSRQRLNTSLAIVAMQALKAYLSGQVDSARSDFEVVASEIHARRRLGTGVENGV